MIVLETREIGGGIVRRLFTAGERTYRAGDHIEADVIKAWPATNRRALIENRFLEVYPVAPSAAAATDGGPRMARKAKAAA